MAFYDIGVEERGVEVSVPVDCDPRRDGIDVHRRRRFGVRHVREFDGLRVTNIVLTLVDFATTHERDEVESAVNAADRKDLIYPEALRDVLSEYRGWPGVRMLRETLDRRTFALADSQLERMFRPIALRAGLSKPLTQVMVNGYRVDFYWPDLGLVVETDGLRYHRTAAQQTADRLRDQAHTAAGLTTLRFTHAQIRYDPAYVETMLRRVAVRLTRAREAHLPPGVRDS
jgi:very-short-patch-repair endonuclease